MLHRNTGVAETVNTVAGLKYHTVFGYFQNTLHRTGSKGLVITIDPRPFSQMEGQGQDSGEDIFFLLGGV